MLREHRWRLEGLAGKWTDFPQKIIRGQKRLFPETRTGILNTVYKQRCVKGGKENGCERGFSYLYFFLCHENTAASPVAFNQITLTFLPVHRGEEERPWLNPECHFVAIYEQTSFPSNQSLEMSLQAGTKQRLNVGLSTFLFYLMFWISLFLSFIKNELEGKKRQNKIEAFYI